ncbi:hypothetical protein RND81_13G064400 [Saponaria officinalis]|uniref:SWIM-type domain-containing protein n=1 Tax=Saponaria officinalis TaxID=3572 RepID=A0AAW1GUT2_SAPOF
MFDLEAEFEWDLNAEYVVDTQASETVPNNETLPNNETVPRKPHTETEPNDETVPETPNSHLLISQAVNAFEEVDGDNEITTPEIGMAFPTGDEFAAFVYLYAYKSGFEFFLRTSELKEEYKKKGVSRKSSGEKEAEFYMFKRIRFMCTKRAECKHPGSNVTGCEFVIDGRIKHRQTIMEITVCKLQHNHIIDPANRRFMFNKHDLRNAVSLERRRTRLGDDARALEEYFKKMKDENGDYFYAIQRDENDRLLNVFWADARCRALFKSFPDVVTYDTTFRSIDGGVDGGVFPESAVCTYSGSRAAHESRGDGKGKRAMVMWRVIAGRIGENPWIKESWDVRRQWVPVYWKGTFCAGMSSTQRSEQQNRFLKQYVSIECGLRNFVTQFENAILDKVNEEQELNLIDLNRPLKLVGKNGTCSRYSANDTIRNPPWKRGIKSYEVNIDESNGNFTCECKLFEFKGILCRHIIRCLELEDIKFIPDKYILERYKKGLVRGYEHIKVGYYDPQKNSRVQKALKINENLDYIAKLAMQDDEAYSIYQVGLSELKKKLEDHVGVDRVRSLGTGSDTSKVWCGRRLQRKENNERHILRSAPTYVDGALRDPVDKRRPGREKVVRQKTYKKKIDASQETSSKRARRDVDLNN